MQIQSKSVLVIGNEPSAYRDWNTPLARYGFVCHFASLASKTLPDSLARPNLVIIDIRQTKSHASDLLHEIKKRYPNCNIPILALKTPDTQADNLPIDSVLLPPCQSGQIAIRAYNLVRLWEMQAEIFLRVQTLEKNFSYTYQPGQSSENEPLKILFIGTATPEFMVIINALQNNDVRVVAAFTSFTAFDYLYEQDFDAVVINGLKSMEPALSVTQTMRKNVRLYYLPTLLLSTGDGSTDIEAAYNVGMNDILNANANIDDLSQRVIEQARFHRLHRDLKKRFGTLGNELCLDQTTGLYNRAFFDAHIKNLAHFHQARQTPVSIALIRVRAKGQVRSEATIIATFSQIGSMLKNIVRLQDMTCRLEPNLFAITFPGYRPDELSAAKARIKSVLECAAMNDPETGDVLNVVVEIKFSLLCGAENVQPPIKTSVA